MDNVNVKVPIEENGGSINEAATISDAVVSSEAVEETALVEEAEASEAEASEAEASEAEASEAEAEAEDISISESENQTPLVCWLCYEEAPPGEVWQPKCKCKGSMQYSHKDCLLQWMKHSDRKKCPQCEYEYVITTNYTSTASRILGHTRVPSIMAAIMIAVAYYCYHRVLTKLKRRIFGSTKNKKPRLTYPFGLSSSFGGSYGGSFDVPLSSTFTTLAAEMELFAWIVVALYMATKWATSRYCSSTPFVVDIVEQYQNEHTSNGGFQDGMFAHDVLIVSYRTLHHIFESVQSEKIKKEIQIKPFESAV